MKQIAVFLLGFVIAILVLGTIGYILLKGKATISMENSNDLQISGAESMSEDIRIEELSPKDFRVIKSNIHEKTLVNFWASWCKACIDEIPILLKYGKQKKIATIFISVDKNNERQKEVLKRQMAKLGLKSTYLIKDSKVTDVTGKNSYYKFLDEIDVDYNKEETGVPFFILISDNGEYIKLFNAPDKNLLYEEYYNEHTQKE